MSDEVSSLSDELAQDPASLAFLPLGDALRREGRLEHALRVAERGVSRHPGRADAHDLMARVALDRGELDRAAEAWTEALRLAPEDVGARRGLGYVLLKKGDLSPAQHHLEQAAALEPTDRTTSSALSLVRRLLRAREESSRGEDPALSADGVTIGWAALTPTGTQAVVPPSLPPAVTRAPALSAAEAARRLFAEVLGEDDMTALLLDGDGLVVAGAYVTEEGDDVSHEVGAELSGVREEADRTVRHLALGPWTTIVVETDLATVAIAPVSSHDLLLLAAGREVPLGLVQRLVDRCGTTASRFVEGGR